MFLRLCDCPPDIRVTVRGHLCYAFSRDDKNVNSLKYLQHRVSGSVSLVRVWSNEGTVSIIETVIPPGLHHEQNYNVCILWLDISHEVVCSTHVTCNIYFLFIYFIIFVYPSFCIIWKCCMFCQNYLIKQQMMRVPLSLARIMSCCMRENVNLMLFTIWCKAIQFKLVSQGPSALGLGFHNFRLKCWLSNNIVIIQSSLSNNCIAFNNDQLNSGKSLWIDEGPFQFN